MWQDEILTELHKIREQHAEYFDYDFDAIFNDLLKKQAINEKNLILLSEQLQSGKVLEKN